MPTKAGTRFQYTLSDLRDCRRVLEELNIPADQFRPTQDHIIDGKELESARAIVDECIKIINALSRQSDGELDSLVRELAAKACGDQAKLNLTAYSVKAIVLAQRQSDAEEAAHEEEIQDDIADHERQIESSEQ